MTADLGPDITSTSQELDSIDQLQRTYAPIDVGLKDDERLFIKDKLSSKRWRMNNLYTIRDKENVKRIMQLNKAQQVVLYDFGHNKKIILKSRQQGISTLYLAYYLDACIFKPGYQAGIQSYGIDEAIKLQKRALLMWEDLDANIKELLDLKLVSSNSRGMTFSNGSVLKIGNFRGDTLQGLHVSELGKIAKRYPEKAQELATGAFQAISKSGKITIESTAEGKTGLFYDMWVKAERRLAMGELTPLDFQPIFLPWIDDPDCYMEQAYEPESWMLDELAKTLKEFPGLQLSQGQLNWYYAKLMELEDSFNQEYPLSPELAFAQSLNGTYFKKQYDKLIADNRVADTPHVPGTPVDVAFDLGVNDEMTMTFGQMVDGVPHIINYYENTGEGIEFYTDVLNAMASHMGYEYGIIYLPHDANVLDMGSGVTRIERFRQLGYRRSVLLKRMKFQDSINGARILISNCYIDKHNAITVVESIQQYSKKYDKRLGVYLEQDLHDVHSNRMASFRYLAQGWGFRKMSAAKKLHKAIVNNPRDRFNKKRSENRGFSIY